MEYLPVVVVLSLIAVEALFVSVLESQLSTNSEYIVDMFIY